MIKLKKGIIAVSILILMTASLFGCSPIGTNVSQETTTTTETTSSTTTTNKQVTTTTTSKTTNKKNDENKSGVKTASFVCVGDNLIHDNIYNEALIKGGGEKYDFSFAYEKIKKYIKGTDVAVVNQETVINDTYEPSTYPMFSTPGANGDSLVDIGFNVVSMSNNHVLDRGSAGIEATVNYWEKNHPDVVHYGAYTSQKDEDNIKTLTKNGITFAFLGYMEHTNGIFLSDDDKAKVVYLSEENKIKSQIKKAKEIADVIVVSAHFGTEVSNEINEQQKTLAPKIIEWGADIIIGTQAHTISTCDYITRSDGTKGFCFYGLGNFLSTMYDAAEDGGIIGRSLIGLIGKLNVKVDFDNGGKVEIEDVKAIPIISHYEGTSFTGAWTNCQVYPLKDYTDDLINRHYDHYEGFSRASINKCLSYIPKKYVSIS